MIRILNGHRDINNAIELTTIQDKQLYRYAMQFH